MFSCKSVGRLSRTGEVRSYEAAAPVHRRFREGEEPPRAAQVGRCRFPFRQPTVFWDGTVVGCEFDYELEMPWGRIGRQPFADIWNSPQAQDERRRMRKGASRPAFCGACPYSARGGGGSILRCRELRPA
jgi:radical SAM protein with 4Fe4S-binding SPASM domain